MNEYPQRPLYFSEATAAPFFGLPDSQPVFARQKYPLITYEKALLGQATGGKFPSVTFIERKQMSTKTSIKRIALVAAAALTLGGFTAVSANATVSASTLLVGTLGTGVGTSAGTQVVGGVSNVILTETTTSAAGMVGSLTSTGVGSISGITTTSHTSAPAGTTYPTSSVNVVNDGTGDSNAAITISLGSSVAGTQTLTFVPLAADGSPGTAQTVTITWGAAAALTAGYVTSQITSGTNSTGGAVALTMTGNRYTGTDATVTASATAVGTAGQEAAVIGVALASAYDTPFSAYLSASISGAGTISIKEDTTSKQTGATPGVASQGTSLTAAAKNQFYRISVFADGRAGVGTVTISSGSTALVTKTVTFYTSTTSVKATQNLNVGKAGTLLGAAASTTKATYASVATTPAFTVALTDAHGNASTGATIAVKSSNSAVLADPSCLEIAATPGTYQCSVTPAAGATSGQSATVTFSVQATSTETPNTTTGLYSITTAPLTFSVGGSVSKAVLSSDATSYTPLAPVTLMVTVTDSKGNPAYDQDFVPGAATDLIASLKTTSAFAGTAGFVSPASIVAGKGTFGTLYAPSIEGDVTVTGLDNLSSAGEAVSATFTVANGAIASGNGLALDAANAATDAANNAYDEAQNATQAASDALAAVTALSAQVGALIATVKSLAAVVAKIKAKVKA